MVEKFAIGFFVLVASGWLLWLIRSLINYDHYVDQIQDDEEKE